MMEDGKEDSLTESKEDNKENFNKYGSVLPREPGGDAGSTTSEYNTESQRWPSPVSNETKLEISESSDSSSSSDSPDYSPPVYKSTTELIKDDYDDKYCCCGTLRTTWRTCKELASDFNSRQWRMLTMLFLGTLSSSLSVCLFPPFFPKLAESKGETATMYGMVIGTNCLTAFIVTPIIGKNMEAIGVNFGFVAGMFGSGVCCSLSGLLEYFNPGYKFVVISVFIRILHATSNACVITSTMAFIAGEFPKSVAFLFSLTRSTMNLAQMFGPALGGALHNVGGFKMPFFVLGSTQVLVSFICAYFLPQFKGKPEDRRNAKKRQLLAIVKIPGVWISFITFIFSTMSNGFLSITLEPRVLREFNISPFYVGILFGLKDGANCLASPVWGWMSDRVNNLKILIIMGSLMAALSFILLGPFPGLPITHTILIVIISLILNGFGVGGQQVAGVISAMKDTMRAGFPDEPDTHAFVASLWSSLSGAGRFISRAGSGILVDTIGFRPTSAIVTSLHGFILLVTVCYVCTTNLKSEERDENTRRKSFHAEADSPSEPSSSKSSPVGVAVPVLREDLEDSFMIGSQSNRYGKRNSYTSGRESLIF